MGINLKIFHRLSLRNKIILWSSTLVGVIQLISIIFAVYLVRVQGLHNLDHVLENETNEMERTLSVDTDGMLLIRGLDWLEDHHVSADNDPVFVQFLDEKKHTVKSSRNLFGKEIPHEGVKINKPVTYEAMFNEEQLRILATPVRFSSKHYGWLLVGVTYFDIEEIQNILINRYFLFFPLSILLATLGSHYLAEKTLSPVKNISKTVQRITMLNLDRLVSVPQTRDEIYYLAVSINELLQRLKISIKSVRQFTANASHELKTPLAVIHARFEQLQSASDVKEKNGHAEEIHKELSKLSKIIEMLSILTKVDSQNIRFQKETVWLNDIIHEQIERFRVAATDKQIKIVTSGLSSISYVGDSYWFNIMISNLLDNAIKYSPDKGRVMIAVKKDQSGHLVLLVTNEGPGVKKESIPKLTERFFRDSQHSELPGTGLGLSIVNRIIQNYNGDLVFESDPSFGFKVMVILPVA
ncbi:MAG: HAMP domain-containing histidine kinase [Candidatus Marinimicrobia bacterium]|nr:HAMP domain-containing histidine kinase [Candidatus Neomarinimicrobiota bacterium]